MQWSQHPDYPDEAPPGAPRTVLFHVRVHGTDRAGAARTVRQDYDCPRQAGHAIAAALAKRRVTRVEIYLLREGELLATLELPRVEPS